jgi:hypothetical protein
MAARRSRASVISIRRMTGLQAKKRAALGRLWRKTGGDLLSRAVARQVPSALRGLTALFGMGRGVSLSLSRHRKVSRRPLWTLKTALGRGKKQNPSSPRRISTGLLIALLRLHSRPIDLVVSQASYSLKGMGELISRLASRLDAFSAYPCRA